MKTITKAGAFILAGVLLLTAGCGNNEVETQQSPLVKTITVGEKDSENDTTFSGTVQIQGNSDIRLFGRSGYGCLAASAHLLFHWPALLKITIQILL